MLADAKAAVVPARAGMSPLEVITTITVWRGPRASGDEPGEVTFEVPLNAWSPRERG